MPGQKSRQSTCCRVAIDDVHRGSIGRRTSRGCWPPRDSSRRAKRLRGPTYETLFGLLAVTGLRSSEVVALDDSDLDHRQATLLVHRSKFGKSRLVPVHETTHFNGRTPMIVQGPGGNGVPTSRSLRGGALHARGRGHDRVRGDDRGPRRADRALEGGVPLTRDPGYDIYEYACHEGNHAISNALRNSRCLETGTGASGPAGR
jgi:integrase